MTTRMPRSLIGCLALTLPFAAYAGPMEDFDADLVAQQFDNCSVVRNGPNETSNQDDTDMDGYGNRCDTDFDQSGTTTAADFGIFLSRFGQICIQTFPPAPGCNPDMDGSGTITAADFGIFLGRFSGVGAANRPGPSGLVCANPAIRIDLGQAPCMP